MAAGDRAWLQGALANWEVAEQDWLGLSPAPLAQVVVIDADCTYTLPQGRVDHAISARHNGATIDLGEMQLPLGPIAFADGSGRFVMSLPSVWRASGITSTTDFGVFLQGVMLHEIMHTRQSSLASDALDAIALESVGAVADDDRIQEEFKADPDYVAVYNDERDLLFAAAQAETDEIARGLAARALASMRARRAQWFVEERAHFAELENVFLTMEGVGQYLMYRNYLAQPEMSADTALAATMRGGWWSQDQGLALVLALDRLLPDWRERAFREPDWRAQNLLAAAVEN